MALWTRLPTYVTRNEIAHGARLGLLAAMALGAAGLCAGGALLLRRDPTCGAHAVRRLDPALLSPTPERPQRMCPAPPRRVKAQGAPDGLALTARA